MRLCFLVEEQYRHDGMPLDVVRQLTSWGHRVDVVWPGRSMIRISDAIQAGTHDAWVLKTVSGGPGLTLLEAAASVGLTTVNDARSIRGVRDKALAAVIARSRGLPVPDTYVAAGAQEFAAIPESDYPLVVKPADGSSGRAVRHVSHPGELATLAGDPAVAGMLIAQPYVPNSGTDLKVYVVNGELYAIERASPLHPGVTVRERPVPLTPEVARIADEIGTAFGLDLYGADIVLGPEGPVVVDINDFPSFRKVPQSLARVAKAVLHLARTGTRGRGGPGEADGGAGEDHGSAGGDGGGGDGDSTGGGPALPPRARVPAQPAAPVGGGR